MVNDWVEKVTYKKVPLSKGLVLGGLNKLEQEYQFNYLPTDEELTSKLELAIILSKGGVQQEYSSLRFVSLAQLRGLLNNLIRAYVFFGRMKGEINTNNFRFKMLEVNRFVDDCFHCDPKKLKDYKE